jgi:hypothetical protein
LKARGSSRLSVLTFSFYPLAFILLIKKKTRRARLAEVDAWLAECDAVAESIEGEFDFAEDQRQIREERASRL